MAKRTKPASSSKTEKKDWPMVVYVWIIGLALLGYFMGEVLLGARPHPLHWAAGLGAGLIGVPVGWLWYRWRGDVI